MSARPPDGPRRLIIAGVGSFAQVAYEYFTRDSAYEVVAFCVEAAYRQADELLGLPVLALEEIEAQLTPGAHAFFAAVVYTRLNRLRQRLYETLAARGYTPASYVSTSASVWPNVTLGQHCFIFPNVTLEPFAGLGHNVVVWGGTHIGHHTQVADHVFFSIQASIAGEVRIGPHCFVGIGATIANGLTLGRDCMVAAGAVVVDDAPADSVLMGVPARPTPGALARFGGRGW